MKSLTQKKQRGATLIVALIMLTLLTLFGLSAMNASNSAFKIATNTQTRAETASAAQREIDKIMSVDFTRNPAGAAGNRPVDINGDNVTDYNVVVATPTCTSVVPIPRAILDAAKATDRACFGSSASALSGLIVGGKAGGGSASGASLCAESQWNLRATATDPLTGASSTINQGVAVRVAIGAPC